MIDHIIKHQLKVLADVSHVFPGTQLRMNFEQVHD